MNKIWKNIIIGFVILYLIGTKITKFIFGILDLMLEYPVEAITIITQSSAIIYLIYLIYKLKNSNTIRNKKKNKRII